MRRSLLRPVATDGLAMQRTVWSAARRGDVTALHSLMQPEAEVPPDVLDDFGVSPLMVRLPGKKNLRPCARRGTLRRLCAPPDRSTRPRTATSRR